MGFPVRAWLAGVRLRDRRLRRAHPHREDLVARFAPGRSFADLGCMWNIDGRVAFLAEEMGATSVTGLDVMDETPAFKEEHRRRGSKVRFVRGDINSEAALTAVGPHEVVWCAGVLYHVPNPILTLERLRSVTTDVLLLGSACLPEVPGLPQACVYYPGLEAPDRAPFAGSDGVFRLGVSSAFDPEQSYGNWFWGFTPSALRAMLWTAGFADVEFAEEGASDSFITYVIARPGRARFR